MNTAGNTVSEIDPSTARPEAQRRLGGQVQLRPSGLGDQPVAAKAATISQSKYWPSRQRMHGGDDVTDHDASNPEDGLGFADDGDDAVQGLAVLRAVIDPAPADVPRLVGVGD